MRLKQVGTLTPRALGLLAGPTVTALLQSVASSRTLSVVSQGRFKIRERHKESSQDCFTSENSYPNSSLAFFPFPSFSTISLVLKWYSPADHTYHIGEFSNFPPPLLVPLVPSLPLMGTRPKRCLQSHLLSPLHPSFFPTLPKSALRIGSSIFLHLVSTVLTQ